MVSGESALTIGAGESLRRLGLEAPVGALPGIGPKRAAALALRGITNVWDVLFHVPARYQDWRQRASIVGLKPGALATIEGELSSVRERPIAGAYRRRLVTAWLTDADGGRIRLIWFNLPAHMTADLPRGEPILARGRVGQARDVALELIHPELYRLHDGPPPPLRPVYSLPKTISQGLWRGVVTHAFDSASDAIPSAIPPSLRQLRSVPAVGDALRMIHRPAPDSNAHQLDAGDTEAHRALALDELFAFEAALLGERARAKRCPGLKMRADGGLGAKLLRSLPFELTVSQRKAIEEIRADLARRYPMNRLLMGDVGSGKTVVAFWAALCAIGSGFQVAMMAPTELLAEQHLLTFSQLCASVELRAKLLTSGVKGAERVRVLGRLASGEIKMIFGTQALIQENVRIPNLGLAIIDEQHRFGVFDRARLGALGPKANLLLMTATPIPRSLAMTVFANLDVSFLDEMPPSRTPVATTVVADDRVSELDKTVGTELGLGHRAYYIAPLIDADDDDDRYSAVALAKRLRAGPLGAFRVGLVHGRMAAPDRERTIRGFRDGSVQVLVSTTVVEVGIDVPEASAIVVLGAERYGLAQLHQLRGRVGRGPIPSRCYLVVSRDADPAAFDRLEILVKNAKGADIARVDLAMRGPGDLLGARQSGPPPLRFIRFARDYRLIDQAREMASAWLAEDPALEKPESQAARLAIERMVERGLSFANVA